MLKQTLYLALVVVFAAKVGGASSLPRTPWLNPIPFDVRGEASHLMEKNASLMVRSGSSVYVLLQQVGVDRDSIMGIVQAAKEHCALSRLNPGVRVSVRWHRADPSRPVRVAFHLSPLSQVIVVNKRGEWHAFRRKARVDRRWVSFSGDIRDSFWGSSEVAEMPARLTIDLADIFASLIDFSRESRVGDRWRVLAENLYVDGKPVGWGHILAAEFENQGVLYSAVRFEREGLRRKYYTREGSSLIRKFLKSPLKFGRITSGFSRRRFHPVLKIRRPHLGIDYGAPRGTPVHAVGDGRVVYRGYRGAAGNTLKIKHSSRYQTAYLHLSRFAKGVRPGTQVSMGQVIGYVGATGRVTGPHLHFEFYVDGRFVDPLSLAFPSADPLPAEMLPELQSVYDSYFKQLPLWPSTVGPIALE